MRDRTPLTVTLSLAGIALYFMVYSMMTPDMYRLTDPSVPINYAFVPDDDEFSRSKHYVEGTFWSPAGDSVEVSILYKKRGTSFEEARLQQLGGGDKFAFALPSLAIGERFFYYLRVSDAAGNEVEIKPRRNVMDRLVAGGREKLFHVTYEGRPARSLLVLHVALIMGAMLLMVHGFHFSLVHILSGRGLAAAYWTLLAAWFTFTISVLPLGYAISKSTFGVGWTGFPVGTDVTDNKSLVVVLYWAVVLLRGWRPLRGEFTFRTGRMSGTTFAGLSLLGIVLTIVAYSIPHSIFVQ
ncbi:MAG: hypothetical protein JW952_06395 [Candidatus Eisenbacteria bacterium]|nr:hypothetical protein [Candidatus Eisenbacteria bacterium]